MKRKTKNLEDMVHSEEFDDAGPLHERPLYMTEARLFLGDLYSGGVKAVRSVGVNLLHLVGGGLSATLQIRLEERLGRELFNAEEATATNALIGKPLFYGALTAYLTQHAGYSPWWGVGGAVVFGLIEVIVRASMPGACGENGEKRIVAGEPILGTLSAVGYAGYRAAAWTASKVGKSLSAAAEGVKDYRSGLRERAIAEQARKDE